MHGFSRSSARIVVLAVCVVASFMAQQSIVRPYQEVVLRSATKDPQNGTRIENIKSKANVSVVQITTSDTSIKNNKSMYVQEVTTNRPNIENIKTKANATFKPRTRPRPPGRIFTCHYSMDNLRKYWFPEYQIEDKYNRKPITSPNNILLDWMHGRNNFEEKPVGRRFGLSLLCSQNSRPSSLER